MTGSPRPAQAITLTEAEQRIVRFIAGSRMKANIRNGTNPTLYYGTDKTAHEIDSYGAEIAYCKIVNCYPDLHIDAYQKFDAVLSGGVKVDVKQTAREGGRLMVKVKDRSEVPDYYALMIRRFPSYRLAGHIAAAVLLVEARIDYKLPHPAYCAMQEELIGL